MPRFSPTLRSRMRAASAPVPRLTLLGCLALLAACTSAPMPPWPVLSRVPPTATRPASADAPTAGRTVPSAPVSSPVISAGTLGTVPPAPYSAAVSARFPAPAVVYATPGLEPGRSSFSTQSEIHSWLADQAAAASRSAGVTAAIVQIGLSQRGETLEALILTSAPDTAAATLQASGRPTVLLIGQQHGDEPAGSEALLVIARELAQGLLRPLLERINVVIVPRANPDGAATDQRLTASGVDMNRDHLLLNTPEAQALAKLMRDYRPTVVMDAHEYTVTGRFLEKFGAVQKFDALFQYATTTNLPEFLTKAAEEWYRRPVLTALKAQGLSTEWYYTTSTNLDDKKVAMGGTQADTGRNVAGLKNVVSLLIETRGIGLGRLHIQRRVHTHVTAIGSALASTAQRADELNQLRPYLDKEVSAMACKGETVVEAAATPTRYELLMLDPVSGADQAVAVDWDSALALRTVRARIRPCGYWLSEDSGVAVERLRLQGVQVRRVTEAGAIMGDSYREISRVTGERQDVRGTVSDGDNKVVLVQVSLARALVDVPRGSYYVSLSQPLANVAVAALEPDTQSSFFANQIIGALKNTVRVMAPPAFTLEDLP